MLGQSIRPKRDYAPSEYNPCFSSLQILYVAAAESISSQRPLKVAFKITAGIGHKELTKRGTTELHSIANVTAKSAADLECSPGLVAIRNSRIWQCQTVI